MRPLTVTLLERIAEQGEAGSVSVIARCLFSVSEDMRKAACQAIHRLLIPLPPDDLLHLSGDIGWSWGWYISDAWDKLQPAEVTSLIADPSCCSALLTKSRDRPKTANPLWLDRVLSFMNTNLLDTKFARIKGHIRHPDHATITLNGWRQVVMNTEGQSRAMRNVAFLD